MKKFNVIDLFAGVGGLSYGFSSLPEFNILVANELEKEIAQAYSLNHPQVQMINCDIKDITQEMLEEILKGMDIDVVIGGPPCQSYSTLGKRLLDDRANLFMQYKRILKILNPNAFVFENVTGLLSMDSGRLFDKIRFEFEELGFEIKYKVINAVDYGVPQYRERVILVGMQGKNIFNYPKPTHGSNLKPYVTLSDAIGDLPVIKSGEKAYNYLSAPYNDFLKFMRTNCNMSVSEHCSPSNNAKLITIMETLQDGQSKDDLPIEIRPKSGYGNTYAKLWWNKPSTTITRNFACPSSSRCIHPRDSRAMTIREGARLQSFPDNYIFYGSDGKKRLQIGNAVPPLLSIELAKEMLNALKIVK